MEERPLSDLEREMLFELAAIAAGFRRLVPVLTMTGLVLVTVSLGAVYLLHG